HPTASAAFHLRREHQLPLLARRDRVGLRQLHAALEVGLDHQTAVVPLRLRLDRAVVELVLPLLAVRPELPPAAIRLGERDHVVLDGEGHAIGRLQQFLHQRATPLHFLLLLVAHLAAAHAAAVTHRADAVPAAAAAMSAAALAVAAFTAATALQRLAHVAIEHPRAVDLRVIGRRGLGV